MTTLKDLGPLRVSLSSAPRPPTLYLPSSPRTDLRTLARKPAREGLRPTLPRVLGMIIYTHPQSVYRWVCLNV